MSCVLDVRNQTSIMCSSDDIPQILICFVNICICEKNSFSKTNHFVNQPPCISVLLLCGTLFALVDFRGYHVHRLVAMGSLLVSSVKSA